MEGDDYIAKVRNCEISATDALAQLEDEFVSVRESLLRIQGVYEAVGLTLGAAYVSQALSQVADAEPFRYDASHLGLDDG